MLDNAFNELENRAEWCITELSFYVQWSHFELYYIKMHWGQRDVWKEQGFKVREAAHSPMEALYDLSFFLSVSVCNMGTIIRVFKWELKKIEYSR